MDNSVSFRKVIVYAGSYVATVIGSGFATGQEIMQFFSFYGLSGIIACLVSMALFAFLGMEVLNRGRLVKPKDSTKIFSLYTGKTIGKFLDWFVPAFLFAVLVVMISGSGATLSEYYGLSPHVGRIGMIVLSYLSVSFGVDKLSKVLGNIGPIIIVFTILVGGISLFKNAGTFASSLEFLKTAPIQKPAPNAFMSGVLYASFNVFVVMGFLAGLGTTASSKKEAYYGGLLGAVSLMLAAAMMYLAILSNAPELFNKSIPTLVLADEISPIVGKLFSIVLILGIFSTAAPLLWQCTNRFYSDGTKGFKILSLIFSILALIGGFLPFDVLVVTVYPYTGYVWIVLLVLIDIKVINLKKEGRTGEEEIRAIEEGK